MASAKLIKLNRDAAIERTLQRFSGWSTSIPVGGTAEVGALARTMEDMRRNLVTLTGTLRRREAEAQGVLAGIAALGSREERMRLGQAEAIVDQLLAELADGPGLRSIQPAGSFRRRRETIVSSTKTG